MIIGLTGTHSTGKTTLVDALRNHIDAYYDVNVTRWVRELGFPINENSTDASQEINMIKRVAHLNTFSNLVADRTIIDNLAYTIAAHKRGNITDKSLAYQKRLFYSNVTKYDLIFYIPPELPLDTKDGVRSADEEYRNEIDKLIRELIEEVSLHHGFDFNSKVHTIKGDLQERISSVLKIIRDDNEDRRYQAEIT